MKNNYIIKNLIVLVICSSILLAITVFMALEINKVNEKLETAQGELAATHDTLTSVQNELSSAYESISTYKGDLAIANENLISEQDKNARMQSELNDANAIIQDLKSDEYEFVYIGNFKLTHYCCEKRKHICGTGAGITATGTQVTAGRTVAVDPSVIPYGTQMYIEGYGWRVAEDCGGAVKGNHIDVAVETHSKAINMGTTSGGVWVLVKKGS